MITINQDKTLSVSDGLIIAYNKDDVAVGFVLSGNNDEFYLITSSTVAYSDQDAYTSLEGLILVNKELKFKVCNVE